jgi:ribosomal protein S18 acetylase RimI-like enzyme
MMSFSADAAKPIGFVVRDAQTADAAGIAAIGIAAVPQTYQDICDEAVVRSIVAQSYAVDALAACIGRCARNDDAHFLVAVRAGTIVGFLHYDCDGAAPELHRIYLQPAEKRKGIGSALIGELHARLAPGAGYVLMAIVANAPAVAFYRHHGLVEEARVDGPTYMHEQMGVDFPPDAAPAPALILRFTKDAPTGGIEMEQYMVERHLPDFPADQLPAAAAAAKEKAGELSAEGVDVRYLRSTYIPEGERCYCLFEGASVEAVAEVQRRAGLPYETIHNAAFLTAEDVS